MPTVDATPPPPFLTSATSGSGSGGSAEARGDASTRRLDDIGVETVLGAMIEQKRRSQPAVQELVDSISDDDVLDDDARDTPFVPRVNAPSAASEVFLKSR